MTDIHFAVARVTDSGFTLRTYDKDGDQLHETRIPAGEVIETIESADETDELRIQHSSKTETIDD